MRRREFVAASCLAGLGPLAAAARAAEPAQPGQRQFYELRLYCLDDEAKRKRLEEFLDQAAVPALNRIGIEPVGVFRFAEGDVRDVYVLLPHGSIESVISMTEKLGADETFLKAGAALLDAPLSDPAYQRIESSLMVAFDDMPKLELPAKGSSRVFQLRTYESHSVKAGQRKVEMFNAGGELDIFRRVGLTPVFFGESLVGA